MWMKLGQYWGERVAVGECRRSLCLFHAGYRSRVELDQQLGLSLTLSAAMTSVYNGYPAGSQQMFGTSAASLQKSGCWVMATHLGTSSWT